jgi:hypothetical protein
LERENEMLKQMMDRGARIQAAKEDEMRKGFLKSVSKLNFEALAMFNTAGTRNLDQRQVAPAVVDEPRVVAEDSRPPSPVHVKKATLVHRHQYD